MAMSTVTIFLISMSILKCRMSNLRSSLCHVDKMFSHVDKLHVSCRLLCRPVKFKGNQQAAKWSYGSKYSKLKKALEIQQARSTEI